MTTRSDKRAAIPHPESTDTMRYRAERGDLGALVEFLAKGAGTYTPQREHVVIEECLRVHATKSVRCFIDQLVSHMLAFDAKLLVRAQSLAAHTMVWNDVQAGGIAMADGVPQRAVEQLEHVGILEDRILEIAQTYAKLQRSLASSKREDVVRTNVLRLVQDLRKTAQTG